jgi:hypothetical protein
LSLSAPENWELVREAWRGFEGLSYDWLWLFFSYILFC